MRDIEHCFFERICPFVCVILTTIRADATVASKINGFELATAFALICKVTAILVLAGKHLVDFFDLNIAKNVITVKTKLFTVAVVLEYTFDSESLLGAKLTCVLLRSVIKTYKFIKSQTFQKRKTLHALVHAIDFCHKPALVV